MVRKIKLALHYEKSFGPLDLFLQTLLKQEVDSLTRQMFYDPQQDAQQSLFVVLDDQEDFSEQFCFRL